MNTKLLRKVAKHIAEEPKRLFMYTWIKRRAHDDDAIRIHMQTQQFPACNTAACIAGWTVLLNQPTHPDCDIFDTTVEKKAMKLLGITAKQADSLFAASRWPKKFNAAHLRAKTARGRAQAAILRIEHFIKTKGAE